MAKHNDISEYFYRNNLIDDSVIRAFKFAFPILRVNARIKTRMANMEFHIIEKYIDKLIAGYTAEFAPQAQKNDHRTSYVSNKNEVFNLLGIDREVYDLANYFYEDLLKNGHFTEEPEGLVSTGEGMASLKLNKKTVSSQLDTKLIVAPYEAKICTNNVGRLWAKTAEQICKANNNRIIIGNVPAYCFNAEMLQRMMNEANFYCAEDDPESFAEINTKKNIPQGALGVEISDDADIPFVEVLYLYYYLVVREENGKRTYHLLKTGNNEETTDFDLNTYDYEYLQDQINSLVDCSKDKLFIKPGNLCTVTVKKDWETEDNVITLKNGNYKVLIDDKLFIDLFNCANKESALSLEMIADGAPFIIDDFEAGKLVYFSATDEQKEIIREYLKTHEKMTDLLEGVISRLLENADASLLTEIGDMYSKEDKPEKAFTFYSRAAELLDEMGKVKLGKCYFYANGVEEDLNKALELWTEAANTGSTLAIHNLGVCYQTGKGVEKDLSVSFEYMERSAKAGLALSQFCLGYYYEKALGVEKDMEKAVYWYDKAQKQGHIVAAFMLANLYMNGDGVHKNCEKALEYFRKVTKERSEEALGYLAIKDEFCKMNCFEKKQREANVKHCKSLISISQYIIGTFCEKGLETEKNTDEAIRWYKRSAEYGYEPALKARERLETL